MNTLNFPKPAIFLLLICITFSSLCFAQSTRLVKAKIDYNHPAQQIEGFGASDAWSCQFAGLWPEEKRNLMADLLFSQKLDQTGSPVGIGLNFWRFAIGGGSTAQGKASGIKDEWRRQPSFLAADGSYDESAMQGQIWFLNAAKTRGLKKFIGFVNSPHVNFTLNHKAFSSDGKCNLNFEKANDFCADLIQTIKIVQQKTGVLFDYISPLNEPQWKWNEGNQEGCPYSNAEVARLVKNLDTQLEKEKLKTRIQIADAGQLNFLTDHPDSLKSQQIRNFFDPASKLYLGDLNHLDRSISGHSYFTTSPEQKAIQIRKTVQENIARYAGLKFWMSEYCVLGDEELKGGGRDLGMTTALFIAKLIHHDLVYANATSWQWWLAISTEDYKDGLVYIDKNKGDGKVYDSKTLWALGNYSRFIPEGSIRMPVELTDDRDLYVSSYAKGKEVTLVAVNNSNEPIEFQLSGIKHNEKKIRLYTTSAGTNLSLSMVYPEQIKLPAKSVSTIKLN
jgi:O-glycosyl hydrolase